MYLLLVQTLDKAKHTLRSSVEVLKGDLVLIPDGISSTAIGIVAARQKIHMPSKLRDIAEIEAVIKPVIPNRYIDAQFGTICLYHTRVLSYGVSFWQNNSDTIHVASSATQAAEKLREWFNADFLAKAEKELG